MSVHHTVARAVELGLQRHGDISEVAAIGDHRLRDDLLELLIAIVSEYYGILTVGDICTLQILLCTMD